MWKNKPTNKTTSKTRIIFSFNENQDKIFAFRIVVLLASVPFALGDSFVHRIYIDNRVFDQSAGT